MGDPAKINVLKREIGSREIELATLVEKASRETGHTTARIDLALKDLGYIDTASGIDPEGYDPDGKMRQIVLHLRWLRNALKEEEEKP
jgi:hypothetical protein